MPFSTINKPLPDVGTNARSASLVSEIFGSPVAAGLVPGNLVIPYACTITGVELLADQAGSIVVDIWRAAGYAAYPPVVGGSICGSDLPTLSSAVKSQDATLTGWAKTLNAGDILRFNVNSAGTVTAVTLVLTVIKS